MSLLVAQVRGSVNDTAYAKLIIKDGRREEQFISYLQRQGISTLVHDGVCSIHGNTSLVLEFARRLQESAATNNPLACVAAGGLGFGLPGIIAANAHTIPVISVPLGGGYGGLPAFLAADVPQGTGAVGTVGVNQYGTAARFLAAMEKYHAGIQNAQNGAGHIGVYTYGATETLCEKLEGLSVPILGKAKAGDDLFGRLVVGHLSPGAKGFTKDIFGNFDRLGAFGIFTVEPSDKAYKALEVMRCMKEAPGEEWHSVYVYSDANAAIFAAKVLAAGHPGGIFDKKIQPVIRIPEHDRAHIANALKKAAAEKAKSYEQPQLVFTRGERGG